MADRTNGTALKQANNAFREKKYDLALKKYQQAIIELPELKSSIEFNIFITRQHLNKHTTSMPAPSKATEVSKSQTSKEKRIEVVNAVAAPPAKLLRGYFDRLDETGIYGWAVDEGKPNAAVELSIFVDDIHFLDIQTSELRKDLIANKIPGSKAGFTLAWPANLFRPGAKFDIKFKGKQQSLSKSPKEFPGQGTATATRENIRYLDEFRSGSVLGTTVIVPIFNAYEAVAECITSLTTHTSGSVKLLLIDDCSTDPRISTLLDSYQEDGRFNIVRNNENLGYTCTVNRAISLCEHDDVVLLNSDTVVTNRWLENLRYCAYSQALVATVTAFSDNAGAFSSPEIGIFNPLPPSLDISSYARIITNSAEGKLLRVPTGNGFCMYIRRAALDKIGNFDEKKFPRGYGEENDFCMRALRAGWHNIVCDKTYVYHKRSQSFQGEKVALMTAGSAQITTDYPDYKHLTKRFRDVEFTYARHRARAALAESGSGASIPRILYVISTQTGGTPQTNLDLMRSMDNRYKCFLLRCDSRTLTLSELVSSELVVRETYSLSTPIEPITHASDEYDRVALDILYRHSIDMLHIRHIAWHGIGLAEAAKSINIPVVYSSHDFYALCPSLNLLDQDLKYCGGSCTKGAGTCQIALWEPQQLPTLKHNFIHRWRELFSKFLSYCDVIISTAPSAKEIFLSAFPECADKFVVIPHGRDFSGFEPPLTPEKNKKIKVLVPGNISRSKGAHLIKAIAELDKDKLIEFNFLGNVAGILEKIGVHHGQYQRAEFREKVKKISPTVGIVLSIWPETYCHTLTEMWACGIPVFGINVGAVGDRIQQSGAGWLIPTDSTAQEIYDQIISEVNHSKGFANRIAALANWQATEGIWNNTSTMSVDYRMIYQRLLTQAHDYGVRIGLLLKGKQHQPATAHIRLLQPLKHIHRIAPNIDFRVIDTAWLLAGGFEKLDAVIIQRDAVPAKHVDGVIKKLNHVNLPYIYEIDDLLWRLPTSHGDHSIDASQQKAIKKLIASARLVTTSTDVLADNLSEFSRDILVIPNSHDKSLWLEPISSTYARRILLENDLLESKPRILYMGTKSHASDLKIVLPALSEVLKARPDVEIIQIGGGIPLPNAREIVVPSEIKSYPEFVRWFRVICTMASIGIAPLEDNNFNAAKSDIKMLDYAFAGIPAIYSAIGPYASAVDNERTGLLVENSTEAWATAILRLLSDVELRTRICDESLLECTRREEINMITNPWLAAINTIVSNEKQPLDAVCPHDLSVNG